MGRVVFRQAGEKAKRQRAQRSLRTIDQGAQRVRRGSIEGARKQASPSARACRASRGQQPPDGRRETRCLDVAEWERVAWWRHGSLHATITSDIRPPFRAPPASMRCDKPSIL
jgi:hypothetical protein